MQQALCNISLSQDPQEHAQVLTSFCRKWETVQVLNLWQNIRLSNTVRETSSDAHSVCSIGVQLQAVPPHCTKTVRQVGWNGKCRDKTFIITCQLIVVVKKQYASCPVGKHRFYWTKQYFACRVLITTVFIAVWPLSFFYYILCFGLVSTNLNRTADCVVWRQCRQSQFTDLEICTLRCLNCKNAHFFEMGLVESSPKHTWELWKTLRVA